MGEEKAEKRFLQWDESLMAGRNDSLEELRLTDFKAHSLQCLVQRNIIAIYRQFLPHLERPFIRMTKSSKTENCNELFTMLQLTRNLKLLDLSFGVMEKRPGVSLLMRLHQFLKTDIIQVDKKWSQLTTLCLDGFTTRRRVSPASSPPARSFITHTLPCKYQIPMASRTRPSRVTIRIRPIFLRRQRRPRLVGLNQSSCYTKR